MSGQDSLQDALDGLINAVEYAEDIGEHELAREISSIYQELGEVSPDEHWDDVYEYEVTGDEDLYDIIGDTEGAMLFDEEGVGETLEVYATEDAISEIEEIDSVERVEKVEKES